MSTPRWRYDAFLSFHGKDTRKGFTDHLHAALIQRGIIVFRDDEKLKRGEYISWELLKAIEESEYVVVVISKNYTFSKWCLIELAKIMECRTKTRLTVLPIFYHVDPSDVRKQKGTFAEGFARHVEVPKLMIEQWRVALKEVGNLAGWHVDDRHETLVIEGICGTISNGLSRNLSKISANLVGIESPVKKIITSLCIGCDDVRFLGLCGMDGIGKTTLAEVIYAKVSSEFKDICFIDNVKERFSHPVSLQQQLISNILKERNFEISSIRYGISVLSTRLKNKKAFIVLDDVDEDAHLRALAARHDWFGLGSRILITSRDNHLVKRYVDQTYEVELMNDDDALQLFSWKAFKNHCPHKNYMELSREIVNCAGGLPLALEIFGSFLFGRELDVWSSAKDRLQATPKREILDSLQISYEGLEDMPTMLFLDIACFFNGEMVNDVIHKLKCLGHYSKSYIEDLKDKSLTKISKGKFQMHDLLVKMGRRIVYRESPNEPGKRSRLWCHEDIIHVLKNNTGTNSIEGILLKLPLPQPEKLCFEAFSKMEKLKMLVISAEYLGTHDLHTIEWVGDPSKLILSKELGILDWWGYPLKSFPTGLQPPTHPCEYVRLDIQRRPRL